MSAEVSSGGAILRRYVYGPGGDEPVVGYAALPVSATRALQDKPIAA